MVWHYDLLAAEAIQRAALPLEGINNIHSSDGFPLSMLSVGHRVPDNVLQKHLQYTPGLFVNESRDPLNTSTSRQTSDGWLGDALNVVTQDLPMPLSTPFTKALATFATSSHCITEQ